MMTTEMRPFIHELLGIQDDLRRFALRLTANSDEAADLTQETTLRALTNEDRYEPQTNFKGWLFTIMRNIFINDYRREVREQTFADTTDGLYYLSRPKDLAVDTTEVGIDHKEIHRIMNLLPRTFRIPFMMHVKGYKYREIAERLGVPLGTVKSRIFTSRQWLQRELKDFR